MRALVAFLLASLLVLGVAPVSLLAAAIVLAVLVGLAGYALHQVGGLDPIVFGVASVTALVLLATAIGAAFVGRFVNRSPTSTLGKALGLVCRMPFLSMSIALVAITLIALKLAWDGRSLTAAMIILVDLHFYGVAAVVLGVALLVYATMAVYRWSTLTRYRAGMATAGMLALLIPLVLVSAIGRALSAPPSPIADPAWTHATSPLEAERELLVDFDDVIEDRTSVPSLAAVAPPAPTNSIRPVSKALIDECFDKLSRDEEQRVRATVQRDNRTLSSDDVADLVRDAMIKVCLAQGERPADNLGAVLTTAARRQAIDYPPQVAHHVCCGRQGPELSAEVARRGRADREQGRCPQPRVVQARRRNPEHHRAALPGRDAVRGDRAIARHLRERGQGHGQQRHQEDARDSRGEVRTVENRPGSYTECVLARCGGARPDRRAHTRGTSNEPVHHHS